MSSRRRSFGIGMGLTAAALAFGGLVLGVCGLRVSRGEFQTEASADVAQQVTVFAIIATPGGKTVDSKLVSIKPQLSQLLPHHGFKLLDAQSKRIETGESVTCDLGNGYTAETSLVRPVDENGKVELRCELFRNRSRQFATQVKAPLNQLFFCERPFLDDGSKWLIGVGVR
jgi:hypothetical protein